MPELQSRYCEDSTNCSDSVTTVQPTFCNTIGKNNNDTTPNRNNSKKKKIGTVATMDTERNDKDDDQDDKMNQGGDDKDDGDDGMGENGNGDKEEKEDDKGDEEKSKDEDKNEDKDDFEIAQLIIRSNTRGLSESQVLHYILEEMFKAINENEDFQIHPTNTTTNPQLSSIKCREQILVDGNEINAFFQ